MILKHNLIHRLPYAAEFARVGVANEAISRIPTAVGRSETTRSEIQAKETE